MRVAQRELKVKVSGAVDKQLNSLLKSLDDTNRKIRVNFDVNDNKLKETVKVIGEVSGKPVKATLNYEVKGSEDVINNLKEVSNKADEINNTRISPIGVATGLAPLAITLDQISDKILNIASQKITPIIEDTFSDAGDLYDVQTSFQKQFNLDGRSANEIKGWMQDIGDYAQKSIYDTEELLSLFSNLEGANFDDSMGLVKALAGISSMAPNASNALKSVSRQVKQFQQDGNVYTRDWNSIRDAIQGVAAGKLNDWFIKNKGIALVPENFQAGLVTVQDFLQAVKEVGGGDMFQGLAQNTDTLSGATAQLRESLRNVLLGDQYNPGPIRDLFNNIVKWTNDFADEIPRLSKKVGKGLDYFNDVIKESFGDFTVKDFFSSLGDSLKTMQPLIGGFIKLIGAITNKGKNVGGVLGNLLKWAIEWKMLRGVAQPVLSLATAIVTLKKATNGLNIKNPFGKGALSSLFGRGSTRKLNISQIKTSALNTAKNLATVAGVIGEVWLASKAIESIGNMDIDFDNVIQNLGKVSSSVTLAGAYVTAIGFALDKWKGFKKNLTTGTVAVAGVSGALWIVTQAIASVSNTKIDGTTLLTNLGALALTISGASVVLGGIGFVLQSFPQLASALAVGSIAMVGISGALALTAKFMSSTSKSAIRISKNLEKLSQVEGSKITSGVQKLAAIMGAMAGFSVISIPTGIVGTIGGVIGSIGNFVTGLNLKSLNKSIDAFQALSSSLNKLKKVNLSKDDAGALRERLKNIFDILDSLADSGTNYNKEYGGKISELTALGSNIKNIVTYFENVLKFVKSLEKYEIDEKIADVAAKKINAIRKVIDKITEVFNGGITTDKEKQVKKKTGIDSIVPTTNAFNPGYLKQISDSVVQLNSISTTLNSLPMVDASTIPAKIESIKLSLDKVKAFKFTKDDVKGLGQKNLDKISNAVTAISTIANTLLAIPGNIDFGATNSTIDNVIATVKKLSEADENGDSFKSVVDKLGKDAINTKGATGLISAINEIATSLVALPQDLNSGTVTAILNQVKNSLNAITEEKGIKQAVKALTEGDILGQVTTAKDVIGVIAELATTLNSIPEVPDIQLKMAAITSALNEIAGIKVPDGLAGIVETIQNVITQLVGLTTQYNQLGVQYATNLINGFINSDFTPFITKVTNLITDLQNKADLTAVGKKMSDTLAGGFDSTAMITEISAIQTAIDNLKGKTIEIKVKRVEETVERANGGLIPEYHSTGGRVGSNQFKHGGMGTPKGLFKQIGTDTVPAMLTAGEYVIKRSVARALGTGFLDALNNMSLNVAYSRLANRLGGGNVVNNTYNNITQNVDNKASFVNGLGRIKRVVRT